MKKSGRFGLLIIIFAGIVSYAAYSEEVALQLTTRTGSATLLVSRIQKKLTFYREYELTSIGGLDKLEELREISFIMCPLITEYGFLKQQPAINTVIIQNGKIDSFSFLEGLPHLKNLVIQGCKIPLYIDLTNCSNLEYLEITNSQLEQVPNIIAIPATLKVLNLAYNEISQIEGNALDEIDSIPLVVLSGNQVMVRRKNIKYDDLLNVLPKEYQKYIR